MKTDTTKLREMREASTGGEWALMRHSDTTVTMGSRSIASCGGYQSNITDESTVNKANAAYIVALHNALPDLLDEVLRLRGVIKKIQEENNHWLVNSDTIAIYCGEGLEQTNDQ